MGEDREFDIVVYGATGVTGHFVVEDMAVIAKQENITWAVAGRSKHRLQTSLRNAERTLQIAENSLDNVGIIEADSEQEASVVKMCRRAKVIINVVGPFLLTGEAVVKSCILAGTSYVDASAEGIFVELMQYRHHQEAVDAGIYIIGACALSSLPCELGVYAMKRLFKGDLNHIETFLHIDMTPYEDKSVMKKVNIGTFLSGLGLMENVLKHWYLQDRLLMKLIRKPIPYFPEKIRTWMIRPDPEFKRVALVNVAADNSSALRSQLMDYDLNNERPVQVKNYFSVQSVWHFITMLPIIILTLTLGFFGFTRNILTKYCNIITWGMFTDERVTREDVKGERFKMEFYGKGWSERLGSPNEMHLDPPNKRVRLTLYGPDPAYVTTSVCMIESALCILQESDKMPVKGVLPPGIAFKHTTLLKRLEKHGITISDLEELN